MQPQVSSKVEPSRGPAGIGVALLGVMTSLVALAGPAVFWGQGCIEEEATTFIRQYVSGSDGSWFRLVFNPHANDIGTYQARELSYLFDLLDALAQPRLARWFGAGFSIPLSALLSTALLTVVYLSGLRKNAINCGALIGVLLLLNFVTSFLFVSTMGLHYRSAKPLLAALTVTWVFGFLRLLRTRSVPDAALGSRWLVWSLCLVAVVGGLLDRQGVFLAATAAVALPLCSQRARSHLLDLVIGMWAAVAALQVYNFWLAPALIFRANGYWPDFGYQRIPLHELTLLHQHVGKAFALVLGNLALMFGNSWWAPAVLALWGVAYCVAERVSPSSIWRTWRSEEPGMTLSIFVLFVSQIVLFALMIARHGYIYRWPDHRFWYYPLPLCALALCGALVVVNRLSRDWPSYRKKIVAATLIALAASNVAFLEHRRDVMARGPWFGPVYEQCELLKRSLRSGSPASQLKPSYRALFDTLTRTNASQMR